MKRKTNRYIRTLLAFVLPLWIGITACDDWNMPKSVDIDPITPKDQNPELWAAYMDALRTYKQSEHFIVYGRFNNGVEKPANAGELLRSLPDSLDMVSLTNGDRLTAIEREDLAGLKEKSTKVLYGIDYASRSEELSDAAKLGEFLDKAITEVGELGLDGFSFTGLPLYDGTEEEMTARKEAARLIVQKLSAVAGAGKDKLLVFEGNPAFLTDEDLPLLNYVTLDTEKTDHVSNLKVQVSIALSRASLTKDKLLITALPDGEIIDEENVKKPAIAELTQRVAALGPLAGLAIGNIEADYYDPAKSYSRTREAIKLMNP